MQLMVEERLDFSTTQRNQWMCTNKGQKHQPSTCRPGQLAAYSFSVRKMSDSEKPAEPGYIKLCICLLEKRHIKAELGNAYCNLIVRMNHYLISLYTFSLTLCSF